jgi:cell division septum initiation protein DivIVA
MSEIKQLEQRVTEIERRLAAMTGTPFASQEEEEPEPEKKQHAAKTVHVAVKRSR